jgi:predicted metal-dependent HD superfamily phosphohydrolase
MNYQAILEQVQQYLLTFFNTHTHTNAKLLYHNRTHTESVVKAATRIANHYQLNDRDFFIVIAAAWFHDMGYYEDLHNHEEKGAAMAENFLKKESADEVVIHEIKQCILATKLPQNPVGLLQQIVCDADLFHLGTDEFSERNKLLRKEIEILYHKKISKDDWRKKTIELLETHHYHTDYCRLLLGEKEQENLEKLKRKQGPEEEQEPVQRLESNAVSIEKNKKDSKLDRGIETVFKITSNNHQRLSNMADSKAHIMISVNSIIISVLLSLLLRKIEEHQNLAIPAVLLLTVNLVTIIYSILATRPNIPKGVFTQKEIDEKTVNLLFFGNFYKMDLDSYTVGMWKMMNDSEFLYGSLIKDVYFQGIVLGRKYRMLRASYDVFMFGIILSVVAFLIAVFFFPVN